MNLNEVLDRLEFLEAQCGSKHRGHGPWKEVWDDHEPGLNYRCIECGAPADHQLKPEDIVA